jgi:hypothetical protein
MERVTSSLEADIDGLGPWLQVHPSERRSIARRKLNIVPKWDAIPGYFLVTIVS